MLSPDGRIVPSTVWYGEGGPGKRKRRRYASEKEAFKGERELSNKFFMASKGEGHYETESDSPLFKALGIERFALMLGKDDDTAADTGFTIEKSGSVWKVFYDGTVWGTAKTWDDVHSVIAHILLYVGDIASKGPKTLKEFIAPYSWADKDGVKTLLNNGKTTGITVKPGPGGFFCHYNDSFYPEDVFPSLEEAQTEAMLHCAGGEFYSMMGNITIQYDGK
jgi:hypothetical protein